MDLALSQANATSPPSAGAASGGRPGGLRGARLASTFAQGDLRCASRYVGQSKGPYMALGVEQDVSASELQHLLTQALPTHRPAFLSSKQPLRMQYELSYRVLQASAAAKRALEVALVTAAKQVT